MIEQEEHDFYFGLYELQQYATAEQTLKLLKEEREDIIEAMYDDISPTMTSFNYETGFCYTQSSRTDTTALKIIEQKERYQALIEKEERKRQLFRLGLDVLTERESAIIQIFYLEKENDLGLSTSNFNQILLGAQSKLCIFLQKERGKFTGGKKKVYLTELAQRISKRVVI